jgi:HK97 family phage portal protein
MAWRINPAFSAMVQRTLFGAEILVKQSGLATIPGDRGNWWFPIIREPFTGAWQRNLEQTQENILTNYAVFACMERIVSDIGKCRIRLVEQDSNDIWNEIFAPAFSPVLTKPNGYQTRIQFFENWMMSKLGAGNTYVLKRRDNRNVVEELYVLDPVGVRPMVAENGDVFYRLSIDNLSGLQTEVPYVPASEIIHDMMPLKFHPLCGISPLYAAGAPALQGVNINNASSTFFRNNAQPGGILSAPGEIKESTAKRLREYWEKEFTSNNAGKVAVLGDGLKFESLSQTFLQSQTVEQMGISAKMVCAAFGVPAYMVGVGDPPSYNNIEALNQQYYTQTLQKHFEAIELLLDEGLGLTEIVGKTYGTEFDLDDLLRLDMQTASQVQERLVKSGIASPDEARRRFNLGPVTGGKSPYLQQQNFSLEALAKRDAQDDPFGIGAKAPAAQPSPPPAQPDTGRSYAEVIEVAAIRQSSSWALRDAFSRVAQK